MLTLLIASSLLNPLAAQDARPVERHTSLTGTIKHHANFESKILGNKRNLIVYLPPDYDKEPTRRYPVLYMHDGQNIFDGMTSYLPNKEWRADECAEALIRAKAIEPIIIVGVDNGQMARADEYLPTRAKMGRDQEAGGKADQYGDFLEKEVMPMIDREYRTKRGPKNTALCGSSFGGIITLYLGITRPNVYGRLGVVSPSLWWDQEIMRKKVEALPKKLDLKIWLDMGAQEGPGAVATADRMHRALLDKGWVDGKDLLYYVDGFAEHNEDAWARRMAPILMYLFK